MKRGAMELSINTIIIVVLGVTLLVLGLMFVRNMFSKLDEISEGTFSKAQTTIESIDTDVKFSVPPSVEVKQGSRSTMTITVGNDGSCNGNKFMLDVAKSTNFDENKVKAQVISEKTVDIKPGQVAKYVIQVAAVSDAPLSTGSFDDPAYKVNVKCGSNIYDTSAFTIDVVKGSGLFG